MATARHIEDLYHIDIVMRDFNERIPDDYHAIVTRLSDETQFVFISKWKWLINWKTRRKAIDRAFKYHDKRQRKLAEKESRVI